MNICALRQRTQSMSNTTALAHMHKQAHRHAGTQANNETVFVDRLKCRRCRRLHQVYEHSCKFVSSNFVSNHFFLALVPFVHSIFNERNEIIYSVCVGAVWPTSVCTLCICSTSTPSSPVIPLIREHFNRFSFIFRFFCRIHLAELPAFSLVLSLCRCVCRTMFVWQISISIFLLVERRQ